MPADCALLVSPRDRAPVPFGSCARQSSHHRPHTDLLQLSGVERKSCPWLRPIPPQPSMRLRPRCATGPARVVCNAASNEGTIAQAEISLSPASALSP